ncbi:MAG: hypothetical protein K5839_01695 [Treponemataceae bacterium]|nr:hypothetical protein [Treponemataceae bacterium]
MLKLLLQNPSYTQVSEREQSDFVEAYIERIKTQTNLALKKVEEQKKNNKVDELATALFGSPAVLRLRNYSESANAQFQKKMLAGYLYHQPLNYMKAFLTDYFKKDIREFADLVLIRGKWSTAVLAKELSDIYNAILSSSEQLNNFDESLGEDKDRGTKLKNLLIRSDKDGEANKIIKTQLRDINEAAFEILTSVSQNLVSFGRETKALLEDREKGKNAQMIINWNELDHFADTPIRELGVGIYKKIYQFVSLMQVFLKK